LNNTAALTYITIKNKSTIDNKLVSKLKEKIGRKKINEARHMQSFKTFLNEDLTLSKSDKQIIMKFLDKKSGSNNKFFSDGDTLEGLWMGGKDIAYWVSGKIEMGQLDSRSKQTVQRFIKKTAPSMDLA